MQDDLFYHVNISPTLQNDSSRLCDDDDDGDDNVYLAYSRYHALCKKKLRRPKHHTCYISVMNTALHATSNDTKYKPNLEIHRFTNAA